MPSTTPIPAVPFHALPELHAREREKLKAVSPGYVAFHREWQARLAVTLSVSALRSASVNQPTPAMHQHRRRRHRRA